MDRRLSPIGASFTSNRFGRRVAAAVPAMVIAATVAVMAASTGLTQFDTAHKQLVTFIQTIGGFGGIAMFGILVWDFVKHRDIGRSLLELVGVILLALLTSNAESFAQIFGISGALI